ncbi:MAG: hypothetical protein KDA72_01530 [Planctomycetales bacterium]|nr:hypothetical protein [Planctomycetales bacterium]
MNDAKLTVRVLRQDHPTKPSYWQTFQILYEPSMNVTSVLQRIAANPTTIEGTESTPVAYEANCLEESSWNRNCRPSTRHGSTLCPRLG